MLGRASAEDCAVRMEVVPVGREQGGLCDASRSGSSSSAITRAIDRVLQRRSAWCARATRVCLTKRGSPDKEALRNRRDPGMAREVTGLTEARRIDGPPTSTQAKLLGAPPTLVRRRSSCLAPEAIRRDIGRRGIRRRRLWRARVRCTCWGFWGGSRLAHGLRWSWSAWGGRAASSGEARHYCAGGEGLCLCFYRSPPDRNVPPATIFRGS